MINTVQNIFDLYCNNPFLRANQMAVFKYLHQRVIMTDIHTLKSESMPSNLLESSGSWFLISSEPMKIDSRWDHVLCTSNHMVITWSAVDSFFCHVDTSSRKWAMYLEVSMFWS